MKWVKEKEPQAPPIQKAGVIMQHKDARKEAVKEAKEASEHLQDVLAENHFTLKIYLAIGGKHSNGMAK